LLIIIGVFDLSNQAAKDEGQDKNYDQEQVHNALLIMDLEEKTGLAFLVMSI
jgi:hypothetical protein